MRSPLGDLLHDLLDPLLDVEGHEHRLLPLTLSSHRQASLGGQNSAIRDGLLSSLLGRSWKLAREPISASRSRPSSLARVRAVSSA